MPEFFNKIAILIAYSFLFYVVNYPIYLYLYPSAVERNNRTRIDWWIIKKIYNWIMSKTPKGSRKILFEIIIIDIIGIIEFFSAF